VVTSALVNRVLRKSDLLYSYGHFLIYQRASFSLQLVAERTKMNSPRRTGPHEPFWNRNDLLAGAALVCCVAVSACVSTSHSNGHPLAIFYLDYARFPQGYFNSGLLDAGGIYVYDAYAENRGEKPIVRKLTPHIESAAWNSPSSISQTMTATAGGSLQVDPSVISPTWQLGLKASVLRETKLDLQDGKKYELKDPASTITKVVNDPQYKGEFSGYRNASRYTVLIVDSFVDGKITVSAGISPKSNQIAVTVKGKQPIAVDISNLHSAMSNGAKILVGFKTYTLKRDTDGTLDVVEDRRDRAWSDLLTKSSPF
jgi:hypothetical protein